MKILKDRVRLVLILIGILVFCGLFYLLVAFTNIPILSEMRNIWIETAMTTADHQWLATKLFPESVINKVMSNKIEDSGEIGVTEIKKPTNLVYSDGVKYDFTSVNNTLKEIDKEYTEQISTEIENVNKVEEESIISNSTIFTDTDEFGNKVIVNDIEEGIKIVEVKTATYTGRLVFIDDPSRVFIAHTNKKGSRGELILNYLDKYDAILGINANGFVDNEGKGHGGEIIGCSVSDGELWGNTAFSLYTTIGFDDENRLVVGKLDNAKDYNLRDAAQFKPALIINGENLMKGSSGWGLQPRTIVGQRADGVVVFLVVDGRKPGYSLGITMGEAADLLMKYDVVTAAACDGGSSSVLAYDGEIINKPSTPMTTGRYLPNAFLVKSKTAK